MWDRPLLSLTMQVASMPLGLVSTQVPLISCSTRSSKLPFIQKAAAVVTIVWWMAGGACACLFVFFQSDLTPSPSLLSLLVRCWGGSLFNECLQAAVMQGRNNTWERCTEHLWQVAGQLLTFESLFLLIREAPQKAPPSDTLVLKLHPCTLNSGLHVIRNVFGGDGSLYFCNRCHALECNCHVCDLRCIYIRPCTWGHTH